MNFLLGLSRLRSSSLLVVPFALAFVPLASGACGGVQQAVLTAEADAGETADTATLPSADAAADAPIPASCQTPQDCNDDPRVSALLGSCESGRCVCAPPSTYSASGKCKGLPSTLTACQAAGGTCEGALGAPGDPVCKNSGGLVLQSPGATTVGCNDAQYETCCIPSCNGLKIEDATFLCIRPTDGCAPPVCISNVLDCPAGTTKTPKGGGCGG